MRDMNEASVLLRENLGVINILMNKLIFTWYKFNERDSI